MGVELDSYLILSTENVSIVLLELTDTSKTTQSTRSFITVQNTKVCDSQRKLSVTALPVSEEHKVSRAVHRLESPLPLLNIELEHVVLIVGPVTGCLPDTDIVHVRGLDLLVATFTVFRSQERLKGIENLGPVGQKEGATRGDFVEEEQLLFLADSDVVTLLCLLKELHVLMKSLLVGEGDTTDTLQGVIGLVTKEICGRVLTRVLAGRIHIITSGPSN